MFDGWLRPSAHLLDEFISRLHSSDANSHGAARFAVLNSRDRETASAILKSDTSLPEVALFGSFEAGSPSNVEQHYALLGQLRPFTDVMTITFLSEVGPETEFGGWFRNLQTQPLSLEKE